MFDKNRYFFVPLYTFVFEGTRFEKGLCYAVDSDTTLKVYNEMREGIDIERFTEEEMNNLHITDQSLSYVS
jgi:hypothetical protein